MNVFSPQRPPPGRDRRDSRPGRSFNRRIQAPPALGVPHLSGKGVARREGCLKAELQTAVTLTFTVVGLTLVAGRAFGQNEMAELPPAALKKLSLEQLMDIDVTSVSRRPEKLSETASAIQVVTGEDIHRSGATSLPEALRLAPNLQVAQVDSRQWAISARGFNNTLANKLLVMIDGRTIYTPLYAGVFWDVQNVMLEDLDRIEVVSGPGGTLWGANAVNGVINVYGVELSGNWQATPWWRWRGGYTYLHKDLRPTSPLANSSVREGNDPQNQFLLQSIVDLPAHFQFDVVGRYVDTLGNPNVPSYISFDVRLAWQYKDRLEISLVGQNLWDKQHPEFGNPATRQEIPHSIYGKVT